MAAALDGADLPRCTVCWPEEWLEAAVKAGLAEKTGEHSYRIHGGDEMRERLQIFASAITETEDDDE